MELTVISQVAPEIKFNKEEIKKRIQAELERYDNFVVTPETIADDRKKRAELNKFVTTIDNFRKDGKKKMSEPVKSFEDDCKELIALLKETIEVYDKQFAEIEAKEKEEKKEEVKVKIKEIIEEYQLDEKHASQLTISASYLNKTNKMPKITTDLKNRAETLKIAQDAVVQNKELIKSTCEMCNVNLKNKLDYKIWLKMYEDNGDVNKTIHWIHETAKNNFEKESLEKERAEREREEKLEREKEGSRAVDEKVEISKKIDVEKSPEVECLNPSTPFAFDDPLGLFKGVKSVIDFTYEIQCTKAKADELEMFMREQGIKFKKITKG